MVSDIILSGLVNLFALIGERNKVDIERAELLLGNYLGRHFGLMHTKSYMSLYQDLRLFYSENEDIDIDPIVGNICTRIKDKMESGELKLVLLRLMEFCMVSPETFDPRNPLFLRIASEFGVDDTLYSDFCDFALDRPGERVHLHSFEGYSGKVKTLRIDTDNLIVFSYTGQDEVLFDDTALVPGVFQVWHTGGVLKNHKGAPIYYSQIRHDYEPASTGSIIYQACDVNFRFPDSDNGLHDLSLTLKGGELVAIMGGSGAGKTTLLSILNGSLKPQQGTLAINGHPIHSPEARALIGFVPQDDLLIEELTVYQNLYYTARLCFDTLTPEQIDTKVNTLLADLGLDKASDLIVGSPLNKTISGGQRKRLNIALELIREPSVIFLDEPTSGLSSSDTDNVMGLLKDQTCRGRLVVLNIHQPSSDVYKLFDRLILLDLGGYPIYEGNPIDALTWFKTEADYADAETSTCPTCGNVNAETVLNIINERSLDNTGRLSKERKVSPVQWHDIYLSRRAPIDPAPVSDIPVSSQKTPSPLRQTLIYLERTARAKLADVQYLVITLAIAPLLALVCALLTRYAPDGIYSVMNNKNLVSYLFMAVIVATFTGMSGSAEEIIRDRTLLKREKFLNLSYRSYIWSKIIYAAIVSLVQTALFILVGNSVMGIHGLFFMWWAILFITAMTASLTGLFLSQNLKSVVAIYITIPILLIPQILLCGLVVPFSDLNSRSTTGNVPLIGEVIPSRWSYEALAVGTYCYNRYERPFYDMDRRRGQALFFKEKYLYELESQLETMQSEADKGEISDPIHLQTLRLGLPRLADACEMQPYEGEWNYSGLRHWLDKAGRALDSICNNVTLERDRLAVQLISELGKEQMLQLKRSSTNTRLEELLTGADSENAVSLVRGHIVTHAAGIFLTPQSRCGRAPFYSPFKKIGSLTIPTLWFNISILVLMSVIVTVLLMLNISERKFR
ncbi:MAG: ATP-binding cassette domain-containing protein [Bacteroidaceae bacterium]|nr:ATP-binding cassette domain-containing protein [Bacteroidaceae bacterium]